MVDATKCAHHDSDIEACINLRMRLFPTMGSSESEAQITLACMLEQIEKRILSSLYSGSVCIWDYQAQAMVKSFEVSELPERIPPTEGVICMGMPVERSAVPTLLSSSTPTPKQGCP
ncbi:unnamed protein product [Urochloa humidicola]